MKQKEAEAKQEKVDMKKKVSANSFFTKALCLVYFKSPYISKCHSACLHLKNNLTEYKIIKPYLLSPKYTAIIPFSPAIYLVRKEGPDQPVYCSLIDLQGGREGCLDASEFLYLCNSKNIIRMCMGMVFSSLILLVNIKFFSYLVSSGDCFCISQCSTEENATHRFKQREIDYKVFNNLLNHQGTGKTDFRPVLSNTGATWGY